MSNQDRPDALQNKYSLVKGAARRARQLQSGAAPLTSSKSTKACRVAQDEIRGGHVTYVVGQKQQSAPPPEDTPNETEEV